MSHTRSFAWFVVALMPFSAHLVPAQAMPKQAGAKAIAALIAQLGSADFQERQAATKSLEAIGRPALAALREAADKHDDAEVRRRAKGLVEKIENSLEQLLEDYKAYGLPLPPKDTPLVRFERPGRFKLNGVEQPPHYSVGFLLKPGTETEPPDILWGCSLYQGDPTPALIDPMNPSSKEVDGWVADAKDDLFLLAIQCKARGWDALANRLFEKRPKEAENRAPQVTLRKDAWRYWTRQLGKHDSDWPLASRYLHGLIGAGPELDSEEGRALLKSLDSALVPSKAKPGSIEAMIDALLEVRSTKLNFEVEPDMRYIRLVEAGFDAVPALIEHLDDIRLTRAGIMRPNFQYRGDVQVRHLATMMLQNMAGDELDNHRILLDKGAAQAWWKNAAHRGEEAQVLASVLPKKRQVPNEQLLWLMFRKYPQHLPRVYRQLLDGKPGMESSQATRALAKSSLAREQKIQAFIYGAGREDLKHRSAALEALRPLDHEQFVRLLIETLDHLPKTPKDPYWICAESHFAELVMLTDDVLVWRALERAATRADIGLRLEFLERVCANYREQHLKPCKGFLAAFLDDTALRDLESDEQRFEAFPAGRDFPRLEVRNFAAMKLALLLKIDRKPQPSWDGEQWARFREKVGEALKR